jgi:hypothetical protein
MAVVQFLAVDLAMPCRRRGRVGAFNLKEKIKSRVVHLPRESRVPVCNQRSSNKQLRSEKLPHSE